MTHFVNVRRTQLGDATQIADIHVRAWHAAYRGIVSDEVLSTVTHLQRTKVWEKLLTENPNVGFVATTDDRILGWTTFGPSRDPNCDAHTGELFAMYVDPEVWRTGVGAALWAAVELELRQTFTVVTLWVFEQNQSSRLFYEHCGFIQDLGVVEKLERFGANQVRYRRHFAAAS